MLQPSGRTQVFSVQSEALISELIPHKSFRGKGPTVAPRNVACRFSGLAAASRNSVSQIRLLQNACQTKRNIKITA